MNPTDSLTMASSMMVMGLVINAARKMTQRTANGVRFGLVLLGTGSMATFSASAFPQIAAQCGGIGIYEWMIPAGAAILMMCERRSPLR